MEILDANVSVEKMAKGWFVCALQTNESCIKKKHKVIQKITPNKFQAH